MRKFSEVITTFMALILIGLLISSNVGNCAYTFSFLSFSRDSLKPVMYTNYSSNTVFINELSGFAYAAHRGAPSISKEPENCLPGFIAAGQSGFKIVETDLQLTRDGQWIIMHDPTLDRTTNGKGRVKDYTFRDIEKLRLRNTKNENLPIPALDDFLKLCSNQGLIPILDIKPGDKQITSYSYNSLLTSLNNYGLLDKSLFCSNSKGVLTELRRRDASTTIAAMLDVSQDNLNFVKGLNNALIYCNFKGLTEDKINLIKKNGLGFGVWTINDGDTARYYFSKGAIIVVTDKLQKIILREGVSFKFEAPSDF